MTSRAMKIAKKLAVEEMKNLQIENNSMVDCNWCKGKGTTIRKGPIFKTHGKKYSEEELNKETIEECYNCKGKGKISDEELFWDLVRKHCGCKCDEEHDTDCYEYDEVFGNTTYLCENCGMVTQFG